MLILAIDLGRFNSMCCFLIATRKSTSFSRQQGGTGVSPVLCHPLLAVGRLSIRIYAGSPIADSDSKVRFD